MQKDTLSYSTTIRRVTNAAKLASTVPGTKYEGNGVSIVEEKGLKNLRSKIDETDEKGGLKMNTVKTTDKSSDNHRLLLSPSAMAKECAIGHINEENVPSSWLLSPESTASTSTSSSNKQHNGGALIQFESRKSISDLDHTSPTSFDTIASQREMWDELRTIETTGSDTFDLLSYLWEVSSSPVCRGDASSVSRSIARSLNLVSTIDPIIDEIELQDERRSPEGSVSTDSSAVPKLRPHATSSTKVKTEEISEEPTTPPTRRRMETRATSTVTSTSTAEVLVTSTRRSERTRASATVNKEREMPVVRTTRTRDKNGRKRYYESDSEDDTSLSQYRECREKNNEASRRSRMNKKAKESEMAVRAIELERDNKVLKMKVEELEKLVTSMRTALLRSALRKEC